jgi:hypothetical protein
MGSGKSHQGGKVNLVGHTTLYIYSRVPAKVALINQ